MQKNNKKTWNSFVKFLCDYLPLIVFFAVYKFGSSSQPLVSATMAMIFTTFGSLLICYIITKKISFVALFSGIVLGVFGGLTILLKDESFIKLKPTIINAIFALILLYSNLTKKPLLSYILGEQIKISDKAWISLSWRWMFFFIALAALNEIIWRNFATDFWVQFKVFGMLPLTIVFSILQMPFMMKEMQKFEKKS